ncbi:fatty acid--CoA ligase family protein [Proteobacteria bacterium 005FR1]|nr:fatty acid--CoA ligase family protein [Proteobacteria bacterium 005FR1]
MKTTDNAKIEVPVRAESIPDLALKAAQQFAGLSAIEGGGEVIDYADLPSRALEVTRALLEHGIQPGDRVALWAPNSVRWVLAALGLQMAGAMLVPINTRMKGTEAADILDRSGARVLFVVGEFLGTDYPAMLADYSLPALERQVLISDRHSPLLPRTLGWDDFLGRGEVVSESVARERAAGVKGDSLSDLMFTSGTTGKPKGVMSSHGAAIRAFSEFVRILGLRPGDRYLVVNPFFHAFGYKAGWLSCLLSGATILPHPVFDADAVLERIERDKVSVLPGPPTLYLSLLAHPKLKETDLSSLRAASTGASTIPPILIERMRQELEFDVVTTAYGLTECGGLATICDPSDPAEVIAGTSGRAIPGTEVSIRSEHGETLPPGEVGEICIRGFHVMEGYFENPQATAETIDDDGWLHTGDVGTLDERGYLRITDRLKDMFIMGGFNCYPAEIENALAGHPAVAQVAVIGVPDERMGEVGCAFIVKRPDAELSEEEVIQWSRQRMANYKVPRIVRTLSSLPVNASNKVDKNLLRKDFLAGEASTDG